MAAPPDALDRFLDELESEAGGALLRRAEADPSFRSAVLAAMVARLFPARPPPDAHILETVRGRVLADVERHALWHTLHAIFSYDRDQGGAIVCWEQVFLSVLARGRVDEVLYMEPHLDMFQHVVSPCHNPVADAFTGVKLSLLPDGTLALEPLDAAQDQLFAALQNQMGCNVPDATVVHRHPDRATSFLDAILFQFRDRSTVRTVLSHCTPMQNNVTWALRNITDDDKYLAFLVGEMLTHQSVFARPMYSHQSRGGEL
eukprot:jgi/Tetstr1/448458/TSEL_035726.t1